MGGVCAGAGRTTGNNPNESETLARKQRKNQERQRANGTPREGSDSAIARNYHHDFIDHNTGGDLLPLSFSRELKPSTPYRPSPLKENHKSSFIGKAATAGFEKAVEVLDTLGSSVSSLNPRSGFAHGTNSRGNIISILAFEVANTIAKGANLFHSLSAENVDYVKNEILTSQGVKELVSTDINELIMIAAADKREEFDVFTKEVVRFGDLCKDPQWHYLGRYFSKLDSENAIDKPTRAQAEATMNELTTLVQHTSVSFFYPVPVPVSEFPKQELYHELHALDRFDQDYQRKRDEVLSLQLPQRESLVILQSELKDQKKLVRSLKKKSLWYKTLEEIMEKLVDVVNYLHQAIVDAFGHSGTDTPACPRRLGAAGLALHYANLVTQIDNIASRPTSLPPNIRDTLYQGLPSSVKVAMRSKANFIAFDPQISMAEVKTEMEKTLHWLIPLSVNTTKAHQGFGWVGEWANNGNEFGKNSGTPSGIIRLQTLYHADKQKMEKHILELVTWLQRLMNIVKQKDQGLPVLPVRSPVRKGLNFLAIVEPKDQSDSLSKEDRDLLSRVGSNRHLPGISRSQEFHVGSKRAKVWALSRSAGNTPTVGKP